MSRTAGLPSARPNTLEQQMKFVYLAGCFQTVVLLTKTFGTELEADPEQFEELRDQPER